MTTTDLLRSVLAQRPLGLVFDIDGTLSPIAPTPAEAQLYPGIASLLEQARHYTHVAIITGRAVADGAAMVNIEGLTYIGTHGLEWCDGLPTSHPVQLLAEALPYVEPGKQLLDIAEQQLAGLAGILVERKRIGGAIHYRLCENPDRVREEIFAILTEPAQRLNMRLSEGKRVVEVRTPLSANKGQALRHFVQRFGLQAVCFAGDDRTDRDAVQEIALLRREGITALAVVVQHADTLPALLEHADIVVQEVEGMVALLRKMVELLQEP